MLIRRGLAPQGGCKKYCVNLGNGVCRARTLSERTGRPGRLGRGAPPPRPHCEEGGSPFRSRTGLNRCLVCAFEIARDTCEPDRDARDGDAPWPGITSRVARPSHFEAEPLPRAGQSHRRIVRRGTTRHQACLGRHPAELASSSVRTLPVARGPLGRERHRRQGHSTMQHRWIPGTDSGDTIRNAPDSGDTIRNAAP
jgi:hypothetical protein